MNRKFILFFIMLFVLSSALLLAMTSWAAPATPPPPPVLISPGDWAVFIGETPELCVQAQDDPDGDAIERFQFQIDGAQVWDSGWRETACVTPPELPYGGFRWQARVKDASGEISDWSALWNFTIYDPQVRFTEIRFDPPSPSNVQKVRIRACTEGRGRMGITLRVAVNDAADGSDAGVWHVLNELGAYCYTDQDAPIWTTSEYAAGDHRFRFQARAEGQTWEEATTEYRTYTLLPYGGPDTPALALPENQATLTSNHVMFQWQASANATRYRLLVSENADPEKDPVVDVRVDAPRTAYTATLPMTHAQYFWRVIAENDKGQAHARVRTFQIRPVDPDRVDTLILFPKQRMVQHYGNTAVEALDGVLRFFANDERIQGIIIDPMTESAVSEAYAVWDANPLDVEAANRVAEAIKNAVILPARATYPRLHYLILAGNDAILPFRRVPDPTRETERLYRQLDPQTPIAAAQAQDFFLSDDYYASLAAPPPGDFTIYTPDLAMGRLVETPDEIQRTLTRFLIDTPTRGGALVTAYSFMTDAGVLEQKLLSARSRKSQALIGEDWDTNALRSALTANAWRLLALNQHATHWSLGAPRGSERLQSAELAGLDTLPFSLALSPGCQAGLNVPDELHPQDHPLDLAQALTRAGGAFAGNTGFGWGVSGELGYSERLTALVIDRLLGSDQLSIGQAVQRAKQQYMRTWGQPDPIDAKIVQEFTLYGIPQARPPLQTRSGSLRSTRGPRIIHVERANGLQFQDHTHRPQITWKQLQDERGATMRYAYVGKETTGLWLKSGYPALPLDASVTLALPEGSAVHGILFLRGVYSDVNHLLPFVPRAENEVVGQDNSQGYAFYAWTPTTLGSRTRVAPASYAWSVMAAQSHLDVMRVYSEITTRAFISSSDDWTAPAIHDVAADVNEARVVVRARATDDKEMHQVWLTYTRDQVGGRGRWQSVAMERGAENLWEVSVPMTSPIRYMVQAVDTAGNIAVADNGGLYFRAPALSGRAGRHCGGVGPDGDYCACVWGFVWVNGRPVADAEVTLHYAGEQQTRRSGWTAVEEAPYYDISGQAMGLRVGDVFTLTARYEDKIITQQVTARPDETGEQRVDLWLDAPRLWLPLWVRNGRKNL